MFSVFTGTAANLLGPSQLLPLFEAVICAGSAQPNVDECGAGSVLGARLLTAGDAGREADTGPEGRSEGGRDRRITGGLSRDRPAWRPVRG